MSNVQYALKKGRMLNELVCRTRHNAGCMHRLNRNRYLDQPVALSEQKAGKNRLRM